MFPHPVRRPSGAPAALALAVGFVALLSPAPAAASLSCVVAIPFLAAGASTTVAGIAITATENSGVQGDTSDTYLHQSNARIRTVLTFSPGIETLRVVTRNHADAAGFERYTFAGSDGSGTVLTDSIEDLDTTRDYSSTTTPALSGPMTRLEIDYTFDTPIADFGRGSYLELRFAGACLDTTSQTVVGTVGSPVTATTAYVPTNFRGTVGYAITSGTLPAGLTLDPTSGVISGIPTATSSATVTIAATGSEAGVATTTVTFSITGTPSIAPAEQTVEGRRGRAIGPTTAYTASAFGGDVTYAVTAGTLPRGLTLDPATGVVSGTPRAHGSTTVTVTATGSTSGTDTATITFLIRPLPIASSEGPVPTAVPAGGGGVAPDGTLAPGPLAALALALGSARAAGRRSARSGARRA
ncbi:MAG: hypothetical protein RLZZ272_1063 [Actinomycetota bacterium]